MLENHLKQYSSAPLPFMGQKRRFIKDFKEALKLFDKKPFSSIYLADLAYCRTSPKENVPMHGLYIMIMTIIIYD